MAASLRPKLTVQPAVDVEDEEGKQEIERRESLPVQLKEVKRERDEARQTSNEWRRKFDVKETECARLQQEGEELRRRNSECQAIILGYEQEMERMKEVTSSGSDYNVRRDLRSHVRDTAIRNQELERLRKTTAEYEARLSELESQRDEMVERLGVSVRREEELERAVEAEQQAKEKANSRNRALSQQIAELHERFERLSHDRVIPSEESETLRRECQTLKEENIMTWKRYSEASHERDRVSKELYRVLDKLRVASEELEVMSVRLKDEQIMRQEIEKRMFDNMGHQTNADSSSSGRYEGVNKQQIEKDLEFAIQSYRSTLKQRDSVLEEVGQLRMENEVLTNQTRIKTQELNELKQKYNSMTAKIFHLKGLVQRLREAHVPELVTVVLPPAKEIGVLLETYVQVTEVQPNSIASQRGFMPGDIVLQVSGQPLANLSVADVSRLIELCTGDMSILLKRQPTARLDDVMLNEMSIDIISVHTQGEKSLDSYGHNAVLKRRDVSTTKVLYGSSSSLTMGTKYSEVASSLSTPTFLDGPSLVARRHEREVILQPPPLNSTVENEELELQLKGGNMVGIFVAHVRKDGPAGGKHGLRKGDELLKVNDCAMTACTLEEANAVFLQSMLVGPVRLLVSRNTKKYRSLAVPYDSFFVRCHFNYDGSAVNEMNFGIGDVLHVTESAPVHFKDSWMARRFGANGLQAAFGAVPNEGRAQAYLKASDRFSAGHSIMVYERIDASQAVDFSGHLLERQYSAVTGERTASLGDQLSLQDRLSAHEPSWTGTLPSHITEELCQLLDRDCPTERDWRDLAAMLGLSDAIPDLAHQPKPTAEILKAWQGVRGQKSSVEWLVKALYKIGRVDAAVLLEPFAERTVGMETGTRSVIVGTTNV